MLDFILLAVWCFILYVALYRKLDDIDKKISELDEEDHEDERTDVRTIR